MTTKESSVSLTVDPGAKGVQHGYLSLPYSHDESAWGSIMTPITVVAGGSGPTVLMTGANHGDEYEGTIALRRLTQTLNGDDINGRLIIVPFFNYEAFKAGRRTSPIDKGNMNRVFPGKVDGTPTEKIADYFQRYLLPEADVVLDMHSGGRTLEIVPFAAAHVLDDKEQQARCVAAMKSFAAPYSMMQLEMDPAGLYDTAAEEMGKVFVTTELGGGGTSRPWTIEIADTGIHNLLVHLGIKDGSPIDRPSIMLDMPDHRCFVTSLNDGLLEPTVELGSRVTEGDLIARVWDTDRTGTAPVEYHSPLTGVLASRHYPGLIRMGDSIAVVALRVDDET